MHLSNKTVIIVFLIILLVGCSLPLEVRTEDAFGKAGSIVYKMDLCQQELELYAGDQHILSVALTPEADPGERLVWSSNNPQVAQVEDGQVIALTEGVATITASISGTDLAASTIVTVRSGKVTEVILDKAELSLLVGESGPLMVLIYPEDALDKGLIWSSDNRAIVDVCQQGNAQAKAPGTAVITVTSSDGAISANCLVTVNPISVTGVSLNSSAISLEVGNSQQLKASISPLNATNQGLIWSSSSPGVASVSSTGLVTAKGGGSAIITVTTQEGKKTATCKVTVRIPVTGVTLNKESVSITADKTTQLLASISPQNATDKNVVWTSSNTAIAVVNSAGLVEARGLGTVTITVKSVDGGISAKCTITFTMPNSGELSFNEKLMIDLVNAERIKVGLQPLLFSNSVQEVSRLKSQDMIDRNYFAHNSPFYGTPFEMMKNFGISYACAGENIAYNSCVERAHHALMESKGHRENILRPEFTHIGLGIRQKSNGSYYITQMFIGK